MTKRLLKDYADTSGKRKSTASSRHSAELFVYLLEYELIQGCMCVCVCVCVCVLVVGKELSLRGIF